MNVMKKMSAAEKAAYREKKRNEAETYKAKLVDGVESLRNSDSFREYLDIMSRFPNYSAHNMMMIFTQKPEATLVQGFNAWKKCGRTVNKGEKALKIFAPLVYKAKDDDAEATGTTVVRGFRLVSVFDISQTSGDELPTGGITRLTGTVEGYDALRETLIAHYGVNVHYERPDDMGEANGWCNPDNAEIAIRSGLDQAQEVKTLIHELAHYLLHGGENADLPRDTKELQAESVAYIVCQHIGLDTKEYSFGYVATWAQDKRGSEIMDALKPVAKVAASIMEVLDGIGDDMAA